MATLSRLTCPKCGHPVLSAQVQDGPERVVLDTHETAGGPHRYAIWDDGTARPVTPTAAVRANKLHDCARR